MRTKNVIYATSWNSTITFSLFIGIKIEIHTQVDTNYFMIYVTLDIMVVL